MIRLHHWHHNGTGAGTTPQNQGFHLRFISHNAIIFRLAEIRRLQNQAPMLEYSTVKGFSEFKSGGSWRCQKLELIRATQNGNRTHSFLHPRTFEHNYVFSASLHGDGTTYHRKITLHPAF
jgi:hypothetical protein